MSIRSLLHFTTLSEQMAAEQSVKDAMADGTLIAGSWAARVMKCNSVLFSKADDGISSTMMSDTTLHRCPMTTMEEAVGGEVVDMELVTHYNGAERLRRVFASYVDARTPMPHHGAPPCSQASFDFVLDQIKHARIG